MYLKTTSFIFIYILISTLDFQVESWHVGAIIYQMAEKLPTARRSDITFSRSLWNDRLRKFIETKPIVINITISILQLLFVYYNYITAILQV